jgi:hypothetical protein
MSNVISGGIPGFYIYFFVNGTFQAGDPATQEQLPLNPITEATGITLPERVYDLIPSVADLYPLIEVDKSLDPSTITLKMHFRELFLLLRVFTFVGASSPWSGTSDSISANFGNRDNIDLNIGIQIRLPDPSGGGNHVDLLFDGGRIEAYRLLGEAQHSVKEEVDIKFSEITQNTQAVNMDAGIHDNSFQNLGGWAYWDVNQYASINSVLLSKDTAITVGAGVAPPGLAIQSWSLEIPVPNAMEFVASSMVAGITFEEVRGPWLLKIDGKLRDNQSIAQAILALEDKTRGTAMVRYNAAPLNKWIRFTQAVLKNIEGISIPTAGEAMDVTYVYEGAGGSVLSFLWTGTEPTNPHPYINYTGL